MKAVWFLLLIAVFAWSGSMLTHLQRGDVDLAAQILAKGTGVFAILLVWLLFITRRQKSCARRSLAVGGLGINETPFKRADVFRMMTAAGIILFSIILSVAAVRLFQTSVNGLLPLAGVGGSVSSLFATAAH